jgi:large conductance mechanosensitive channel
MFREFRAFIMRGSVVDLAVGIVIGAAFGAVVAAFVGNILTPLIAALGGKPDFGSLIWTVNGAQVKYGLFINALITFVLVAAALFFFVVKPINALTARSRREPAPEPDTTKCPECLSVIPAAARRCAYCTAPQPGAPAA